MICILSYHDVFMSHESYDGGGLLRGGCGKEEVKHLPMGEAGGVWEIEHIPFISNKYYSYYHCRSERVTENCGLIAMMIMMR